MSYIDVKYDLVVAYNVAINFNKGFNEIKSNPNDFDYRSSLNNFVNP